MCASPRAELRQFLRAQAVSARFPKAVECEKLTILEEDREALLDEKIGVEDDESE
jgi:hypothetical protein